MDASTFAPGLKLALEKLRLVGQPILVAVSGGADSVALLRGLCELRDRLDLDLQAAHLNHQLRGDAASADARWLEQLCRSLAIPLTLDALDVGALARDSGRGIEEAARDARYRFLEQAARDAGSCAIAVAHTADDQAETILHHVLRGTGLGGLGGMSPSRPLSEGLSLVRPMLSISRAEVIEYLASIGQDFRVDETNADESFTRNRLRRKLLPQLEGEYNPALREALCRLGEQAAQAQAAITACALELLERVLESAGPQACRLRWQPLRDRPRHLVREVLMALWKRQNWPRQAMSFEHWDRAAQIVLEGGASDFPGQLHASRSGKWFSIEVRVRPKAATPSKSKSCESRR